jgi:hypothetical protein
VLTTDFTTSNHGTEPGQATLLANLWYQVCLSAAQALEHGINNTTFPEVILLGEVANRVWVQCPDHSVEIGLFATTPRVFKTRQGEFPVTYGCRRRWGWGCSGLKPLLDDMELGEDGGVGK